jgi:cysteine desulfurase
MDKHITYLDNNATTMVAPEVVEAMEPYFSKLFGNPSSHHLVGSIASKAVKKAREQVALFIGAEPDEIVFTGCGTESNNLAIKGAFPERIITSEVEHPSILSLSRDLGRKGTLLDTIGVNSLGVLDKRQIKSRMKGNEGKQTILSFMWANNETGVIFPIGEIAELSQENENLFHVDAVQAAGKVAINVSELPVDLLSISGHKIHAPKGIGALYVRKDRDIQIDPLLVGGHQERGFRAGTENVPYIVGLGVACELAAKEMGEMKRIGKLRDKLQDLLTEAVPDCIVNGKGQRRVANTLNIAFPSLEADSILASLSSQGICISSGSACSAGSLEPSHVIRAMQVPTKYATCALRFSLSRYSTEADIEIVAETLPGILKRHAELSPFA